MPPLWFIVFTAINVVFLALGSLLLLRPAVVIRFQGRRYIGRPVPDNQTTRAVAGFIARMPRFMLDRPDADPVAYRDELYENPSNFPRVMWSYRVYGALLIFLGVIWLLVMVV